MMRGADHLIALRKRHLAPVLVFVDTSSAGSIDEESNKLDPSRANVWIEPEDRLARLDLRCFVGLSVSVTGDDRERVADVTAAILKAGARRVIAASHRFTGAGEFTRAHLTSLTDSVENYKWTEDDDGKAAA